MLASPQQAIHAPLELTLILTPGNDLLAGIAALAETHTAQLLEVEHLRNESFAGVAAHLPQTQADLLQLPGFDGQGLRLCTQGAHLFLRLGRRQPDLPGMLTCR